jgi:hypothetical protein
VNWTKEAAIAEIEAALPPELGPLFALVAHNPWETLKFFVQHHLVPPPRVLRDGIAWWLSNPTDAKRDAGFQMLQAMQDQAQKHTAHRRPPHPKPQPFPHGRPEFAAARVRPQPQRHAAAAGPGARARPAPGPTRVPIFRAPKPQAKPIAIPGLENEPETEALAHW